MTFPIRASNAASPAPTDPTPTEPTPTEPTPTDPVLVDRARAAALDAADPLATFRDRFVVGDPDLVYLDGNSLGRLSLAAADRIERVVRDEWGGELTRGWDHWIDLPLRIGDRIGEGLLGARPGEVVVSDSTTVNLYKLAAAALDARPARRTIVAARDDFPTDRYVLEGLARARDLTIRWLEPDPIDGPTAADVEAAVDDDVALVVLSHVHYRSAAIADMPAITALAHRSGALMLWDLSHTAGSVVVDLESSGVDLAVGCSYKHIPGGPGAPAWLYVRKEHQAVLHNPIQGWFGQRDRFAMGPAYDPLSDIRAFLTGTPGVVALAAVEAGVELVAEARVERIRAKGVALTEYAIALHDAWLAPLGCTLGSPRDAARRGAHIAVRHPDGERLTAALIAGGVIPDFRWPDSIRFGVSPLATSFGDVHTGIDRLRAILGAEAR
ncbi:MAG: kynureninase [Chloroflexi bacterium]|nr:kynureninase [Chloroflexota bacterium]